MITKPMLASKCTDLHLLPFPVLATPKLDGIRCLKIGGEALTRSFKSIPNVYIREWIETNLPDGVDGELMVRNGSFSESTSAISSREGEPDFVFHVFDYVKYGISQEYTQRMDNLSRLTQHKQVELVLPTRIADVEQLLLYEEQCIDSGYEGVMVRTPQSPYKCGRSTEREGWLLKIKRFEDAEAQVLETYEGKTNGNEAEQDAFGRTKRSSSKANVTGRGELGGFVVRHLTTGVIFRLGYNHVTGGKCRTKLWMKREALIGKLVKFRHQPSGSKDAPRFPTFLGFREKWDL